MGRQKIFSKRLSLNRLEVYALYFVLFSLFILYFLGVWVFIQNGRWPSYGAPESWSSFPVSNWPRTFEVLLACFIVCWLVAFCGVIYSLFRISIAVFVKKDKTRLSGWVVSLFFFLVFALDPFGLLVWFLD